jgi:hypothetical protein
MKPVWSSEIDPILSVGKALDGMGIRNWALERHAALSALERLSELGIGVLGGDVYHFDGKQFQPNRDNWFCKRHKDDQPIDFVARSIAETRRFIRRYPVTATAFFALVPDV